MIFKKPDFKAGLFICLTIELSTQLDSNVRQSVANYFANEALATAMQSDKELD